MAWMRFLSILVLAVWVGGLIVLGALAAPTIFAVLSSEAPSTGRALGGVVFGAIFERFQHLAWGLGGVLMALLGARAALGPRPRRLAVRLWTVAAMLAVSVISSLVLARRIEAIRHDVNGTVAELPESDERRIEFGRLHALSNGLMLLTLAAGLGLLWAEVKDA